MHPSKAELLIVVNELSMISDEEVGHPKYDPYDLTEEGIAKAGTSVPVNTNPPIEMTLGGMIIDARELQSLKA